MLRPADTSPEAWEIYLDIQRRMTPGEKISQVLQLSELLRQLGEAEIRRRYPAAEDCEVFLRWARMKLGPDLFSRAYGDVLPDDEPLTELLEPLALTAERNWVRTVMSRYSGGKPAESHK